MYCAVVRTVVRLRLTDELLTRKLQTPALLAKTGCNAQQGHPRCCPPSQFLFTRRQAFLRIEPSGFLDRALPGSLLEAPPTPGCVCPITTTVDTVERYSSMSYVQ